MKLAALLLLLALSAVQGFISCTKCLSLQLRPEATAVRSSTDADAAATAAAAAKPEKEISPKHKAYLEEAAANRKRAAESRLMNSKKFWRKKVVYDFVRTKQRAERKEEAASTRWERNVTVALSDLQQGQWLPGKVRNLQPFGAWIDIGAERDGLLHVSDMSEGFTPSVADAVYTGQLLNVTVKFVDAGASKLALSLVPLTSSAAAAAQRGADGGPLTAEPLEAVEAGDELWGEVVKVTNFGAYVECGVD
eukprot:2263-Heterococcus_DN1.PRE.2